MSELQRKDVERYVCNMSQLCGIKEYTLENDTADGIRVAEFYNGSGLSFAVLKSRGLDIAETFYNGIPLFWKSFGGVTFPSEAYNRGFDFLRCFYGGLLITCGITYTGRPCVDNGEELGLHGRYSNQRAKVNSVNEYWQDNRYVLELTGEVKEASVFGPNVKLDRRIRTVLGEPVIEIDDIFTNCGNTKTTHAILYHLTFGYPLVDEGARLVYAASTIRLLEDSVRDPHKSDFKLIPAPLQSHNGSGQDFIYIDVHPDKNGAAKAALINEKLGLGVAIEYPKSKLPHLGNLLKFGEKGEYMISFEPMNSSVEGRAKDRKSGLLEEIEPGGTKEYHMKLTVLRSVEEIERFESEISRLS